MTAIFLFDGDCGFCTRCADWLGRHVSTDAHIVAWQRVDLTPLGVSSAECAAAVQWIDGATVSGGPAAIADLLRTATGRGGPVWRGLGRLLSTRPILALAWPGYRFVARHRHRLPGGTSACALPATPR